MKAMIITPVGGALLLLPGNLYTSTNWVSWDTPGHGQLNTDRARARVQHILDTEELLRNGEPVCRPLMQYSPTYCADSTLSLIVGVDTAVHTNCDDGPPYPALTVQYAVSVYCMATNQWQGMQAECTYLVPRLHPSEHNLLPDGTGPLGISDMMGGILCTHREGTEPCNMLRELMRSMGHLPHQFINYVA